MARGRGREKVLDRFQWGALDCALCPAGLAVHGAAQCWSFSGTYPLTDPSQRWLTVDFKCCLGERGAGPRKNPHFADKNIALPSFARCHLQQTQTPAIPRFAAVCSDGGKYLSGSYGGPALFSFSLSLALSAWRACHLPFGMPARTQFLERRIAPSVFRSNCRFITCCT